MPVSRQARPTPRLPLLLLLPLAAVLTLCILLPGSAPGSAVLYLLYIALCALSALVLHQTARNAPPVLRRGWSLLALGLAVFTAGEVIYAALDLTGAAPTFPSVADVFYLAFIPLVAFGLGAFPHEPLTRTARLAFLIDITLAVGITADIVWHSTALPSTVAALTGRPVEALLGLAYPATDLVLLATLFALAVRRPVTLHRRQLLLLGSGMALYLVADLAYINLESQGLYAEWSLIDLGWAYGFVLFALAGLPVSERPVRRAPRAVRALRRLEASARVLPYVLLATAYGTYAVSRSVQPHGVAEEFIFIAVTALLFVRFVLLLQEHQRAVEDLRERRHRDLLTGLPNRAALLQRLSGVLATSDPHVTGVVYVDLDRMRHVNDWYGHQGGDRVLGEAARRLVLLVRGEDVVARVEGDEFVLLLTRLDHPDQAVRVARRVLDRLAQPFEMEGEAVHVTASVGIAVCPRDADDPELAVHNASLAMLHAKENGKNTLAVFAPHLARSVIDAGRLENHLRQALAREELDLHFQPLVDLRTNRVVGFEALLRWTSDTLGVVPPRTVVEVAEERGLMAPLSLWVLRRATAEVARWRAELDPDLYVTVNVSPAQFDDLAFIETIERALAERDLPGDALCLELTEHNLIRDVAVSRARLLDLRRLGVRVALDDFGTGYSSLSYLRQLPVDVLKIDQSFVRGIDEDGPEFVRAIVRLGLDLGFVVVAEGIETEGQRETLRGIGCHLGQGYRLGRPMAARDVERHLNRSGNLLPGDGD